MTEQFEYYRISPYGDNWRQIARLCYVIAAGQGLKKTGGGSFTEDDFMPFPPPKEVRNQGDQEVESIMQSVLGGLKKEKAKQKPPKKPKKK